MSASDPSRPPSALAAPTTGLLTAASRPAIASPPAIDTSRRIGLALGGGGARGIGHVAILEVFDELGIKPSFIAGTSIGALIGAAYAGGMSAALIRAQLVEALSHRFLLLRQLLGARSQPIQRLLNVLPLRSAVLDPEVLLDIVLPSGMPERFEDLEIPFLAVATDMQAQTDVDFATGLLKPAIAASIAIPVLFSPVRIDGRLYADGGLVDPLPIGKLAGHADLTIAVDVTGERDPAALAGHPSVTTMLVHSIAIIQKTIIRERLLHTEPDILMSLEVGTFGALQFHKVNGILEAVEPAKAAFRDKLVSLLSGAEPATAGSPAKPGGASP
jgi:NTE family protein